MNDLIRQIENLKTKDDSCGLKQNVVIDKVLKAINNYTCKNALEHPRYFVCNICKGEGTGKFIYCPNCGRRIEECEKSLSEGTKEVTIINFKEMEELK